MSATTQTAIDARVADPSPIGARGDVARPRPASPSGAAWLRAELELQRRESSLADHPYLTAWRRGLLTRDDLQVFASEHDNVVVAVAAAARAAAEQAPGGFGEGLAPLAADAAADVERWRAFSLAVGWCHSTAWMYGADPLEGTIRCARTVVAVPRKTAGELLAAIWAVNARYLEVVPVQAAALSKRYGIDGGGAGWFDCRSSSLTGIELVGAALDDLAAREDPHALLGAATATFTALRGFFDCLEDDRAIRSQEALRA